MKVLLVYPEFPETFWSFKHALRFVTKKATSPPLGLLTVAALLPVQWEKRLIDLNVTSLTDRNLAWADYLFISAMSVQRESVERIVRRCRQQGVKIVAGGPLFTEDYEEFPDIDHLVLNEAEITLPGFLGDLGQGCAKRVYRTNAWADITQTPIPLWELVDLKNYASMDLQYSRGCPFNCDFCDITTLYGRFPRTKEQGQFLREIEALHNLGWRGNVFLVDDNFIGNRKKLKDEILPAIQAWQSQQRYPFRFYTQTSIDLSDDDQLMRQMVEAGFNSVFVGIETPCEESLTECRKNQNKNRDLVACVKKMQRIGLQVQGGFIVGFDHDPPSIFAKQIEFIQKSGIVTAMVGLLSAVKGTELYQRLSCEQRILHGETGNNTDGTINFIPRMPFEQLLNGYREIIGTIYAPKFYYRRVRECLMEFRPFPLQGTNIAWTDLKAFFKSVILIGVLGKERFYYWRLIIWSLVKKPCTLPLAVTYAIYGFHFRKVFERLIEVT